MTVNATSLLGCHVLVVEDDYLIADDVSRRLVTRGARVLGPVASLDAANAFYRERPAMDVAVLDINLRGTAVYPFAERLVRDGVPFLFCTGYGEEPVNERFRDIIRFEKPLSHQAFAAMALTLARLASAKRNGRAG